MPENLAHIESEFFIRNIAAAVYASTDKVIEFFTPGDPRPGGSKTACLIPKRGGGFIHSAKGRPIINMKDAGGEKTESWKSLVSYEGRRAYTGPLLDGPLFLIMKFVKPRLKGHFGKNGLLATAPPWPTVKPDLTKYVRAAEDALTNIIWKDDAMIVGQLPFKIYGEQPGLHIEVRIMRVGEIAKVEKRVKTKPAAPLFQGRVAS